VITRHRVAAAVVLVLAVGLTAGCAGQAGTPGAPTSSGSVASPPETLTVFAAASLVGTFTALADQYETAHPGVTVTLNFAGSADLVTQITEGAPADVFAAADTKNMARLSDAGLVAGTPAVFATNTLEIAVPPTNPAAMTWPAPASPSSPARPRCPAAPQPRRSRRRPA
jgi:molybdate transport system substrate-binding protein